MREIILLTGILLLFSTEIHLSAEEKGDSNPTIKVAGIFGDNMVLQQGMKVSVWGWSVPNDAVTVEFAGQKKTAAAGKGGKWIPPQLLEQIN